MTLRAIKLSPSFGKAAEELVPQNGDGRIQYQPAGQVREAAVFDRVLVLAHQLRVRCKPHADQDHRCQPPQHVHCWMTRITRGAAPAVWVMLKACGCAPNCMMEAR